VGVAKHAPAARVQSIWSAARQLSFGFIVCPRHDVLPQWMVARNVPPQHHDETSTMACSKETKYIPVHPRWCSFICGSPPLNIPSSIFWPRFPGGRSSSMTLITSDVTMKSPSGACSARPVFGVEFGTGSRTASQGSPALVYRIVIWIAGRKRKRSTAGRLFSSSSICGAPYFARSSEEVCPDATIAVLRTINSNVMRIEEFILKSWSRPGSQAGLLPPSPLRTGRESFPPSGSSISEDPSRDPARFNCKQRLHETHLRPTRLRGRAHQLELRLSSAFSPKSVYQILSWRDTRWKSARLRVEVMLPEAQPLSARLPKRHSLVPSSHTRSLRSSPYGSLSRPEISAGRTTGLPRSAWVPEWVRSRLSAGGAMSASGEFETPEPGHLPFGPSLSASLACSQ